MDHFVHDPDIMSDADRLLNGRTRAIRLKGKIAQAFRERSWAQTAKIIRAWMIWVMLLDLLTLTLNMMLLPKTSSLAMLAPGSIIPPAAIAVYFFWRRRHSDAALAWSLASGMFFILLAVGLMGVAGGGEFYERYLNVMLFVALTGIIIFNVPFAQTVTLAVVALGQYFLFQMQNPTVEIRSTLSAFLFFASGIGATVVARRTMTILAQKSFLLELRDRRRLVELGEANDRLERLSKTDPLTGVANRRWMTEVLERLWSKSENGQPAIAMLMCDIDQFKALNDRCGHAEGDRCLAEVARIIGSRIARDLDYVARYGGEEFLVLLPGASETAAMATAERIRQSVVAAALPNPGSRVSRYVTLSIGVAVQQSQGPARTPDQLQSEADAALYQAKRAGRNRVELHQRSSAGVQATPNVA